MNYVNEMLITVFNFIHEQTSSSSAFTFWCVSTLILLLSGSSLNSSFNNSRLLASLLLKSSKWVKQHINKMSALLTDAYWADGKELLGPEKSKFCLGHWVHLWETKQVELRANMGKIGPKLKSGYYRTPYLVYWALWRKLEMLCWNLCQINDVSRKQILNLCMLALKLELIMLKEEWRRFPPAVVVFGSVASVINDLSQAFYAHFFTYMPANCWTVGYCKTGLTVKRTSEVLSG